MFHVRAGWARLGLAGAGEQGAGGLSGWRLLWAARAAAPWLAFGHPSRVPANSQDKQGHRGAAAAGGRLPRPGSHLVSGAGAARAPRAARAQERTRTRTLTRAGRPGRRRRAGGYRCLPPAALGSRPRAVGEGSWVVAEEEGSGGGDQPAPARPSPARCPGRTRRPGRRWRTSRRRSRTCRPWWDTRTGSPSPPR